MAVIPSFRNIVLIFILRYLSFGLSFPFDGQLPGKNELSYDASRDVECLTCRSMLNAVRTLLAENVPEEEIMTIAVGTCIALEMFTPDVCQGMVDISGPEVIYVLNNTEHDSNTACGFLLGGNHCNVNQLDPWDITIPGGKPEPFHPEIPWNTPARKILHISDLHIDHQYVVDSPDECEHPLCCRAWGDEVPPESEPAGFWGAKGTCDLPIWTLDNLLEAAALQNPDIIYVTGDLPGHDVWAQSHSSNLADIDIVVNSMLVAFPETPVVMTIGNHETTPVNSFSLPSTYSSGFNMTWLYGHLAETWSQWLPDEAATTLRIGGYFSLVPFPGLRVISINTNFCNRFNWWLLLHHEDPSLQLQWLVQILTSAESEGEKVHIIGHIPAGSDGCAYGWSHAFNKVVTRFESTITGLFYGHHHRDQWQIMWDVNDDTRPVGVSFLPPSVTSSGEKNPSFRIYSVDGEQGSSTWTIIDHESWSMNLTLANANNDTVYEKIYTALSNYGLSSMTPDKWNELTFSMATDDALFEEYLRHYYNFYAEPEQILTCESSCRKDQLCRLVTSDASNEAPCERIREAVDAGMNSTTVQI